MKLFLSIASVAIVAVLCLAVPNPIQVYGEIIMRILFGLMTGINI